MWRYLIILFNQYYFQFSLVIDDEDEHTITAGACVTLTVHLHRENMSTVFSKEMNVNNSSNTNRLVEEINEEQIDEKENREKVVNVFLFIHIEYSHFF